MTTLTLTSILTTILSRSLRCCSITFSTNKPAGPFPTGFFFLALKPEQFVKAEHAWLGSANQSLMPEAPARSTHIRDTGEIPVEAADPRNWPTNSLLSDDGYLDFDINLHHYPEQEFEMFVHHILHE